MTPALPSRIAILTIGSEVVDGRVLDINANYLAWELGIRGLAPRLIASCNDDSQEMLDLFAYAATQAEILILSGGLGATSDDRTREVVASFCDVSLTKDENVLQALKALYELRKRVFLEINERQAFFPAGASVIPNPVGLACGFQARAERLNKPIEIFSLPGVPGELKAMFQQSVLPAILSRTGLPQKQQTIKVLGIPESTVGAKIESLQLPEAIEVCYRAAFPDVHVVLRGAEDAPLLKGAAQVREVLGTEFVFSDSYEENFFEAAQRVFLTQKKTLACAESCTGGMLGSLITQIPGSSDYFLGSIVSYANTVKRDCLGVPQETLDRFGAVSVETAQAMARGARERLGADVAVSITGIAGPDGGSDAKPVGLFYVGLSTAQETRAHECFFRSHRQNIRTYAAYVAMDVARRHVGGLPEMGYCRR